jgi:hypothetical protein
VSGRDVYVGGMFTMAGGLGASNLAKWNGSEWSAFDLQTYDGVRDIAVRGRWVYVGGASFTLPDGVATKGIVKWDGRDWSALGGGVGSGSYTGPVMAIAPSGGDLYVGGDAFSLPDLAAIGIPRPYSSRKLDPQRRAGGLATATGFARCTRR